jgi:hypothetical protein
MESHAIHPFTQSIDTLDILCFFGFINHLKSTVPSNWLLRPHLHQLRRSNLLITDQIDRLFLIAAQGFTVFNGGLKARLMADQNSKTSTNGAPSSPARIAGTRSMPPLRSLPHQLAERLRESAICGWRDN